MVDGDEEIDDGVETGTEDTAGSSTSEDTSGQDAQSGDDEAEGTPQHADDSEDDGEPQPGEQTPGRTQAPPQSRGSARFQRLSNETKAAKEEADKARRELEDFKRQQWAREQQQNEAVERERRSLMTPQERNEYDITQMRHAMAQMHRNTALQMQMSTDKIAFDAACRTDPLYRRYAAQVEAKFNEQLAKGAPVEREVILRHLIGDEAIASARNGSGRRAANGRVNAQRVKASNSKGDQAAARGKTGSTAEERLKGVFI